MPPETNLPTPPDTPKVHRNHERYCANLTGFVRADGHEYPCRVTDVSPFGAMVEFADDAVPLANQQIILLRVPKVGQCHATLCWSAPQKAGIEFRISAAEKDALEDFLMNVLAEDL